MKLHRKDCPLLPSAGFSLIELMITVAIVALLAAIAVPSYTDYLRRGAIEEGTAALASGRVALEQYFLDHRSYVDATCPTSTAKFTVSCTTTATTYVITATGIGNVSGFVYTLNETGLRTTAGPWGTGASCWITQKGTAC